MIAWVNRLNGYYHSFVIEHCYYKGHGTVVHHSVILYNDFHELYAKLHQQTDAAKRGSKIPIICV